MSAIGRGPLWSRAAAIRLSPIRQSQLGAGRRGLRVECQPGRRVDGAVTLTNCKESLQKSGSSVKRRVRGRAADPTLPRAIAPRGVGEPSGGPTEIVYLVQIPDSCAFTCQTRGMPLWPSRAQVDSARRPRERAAVPVHRIEIETRADHVDPVASQTKQRLREWLGLEADAVRTRKVFLLDADIDAATADRIRASLTDSVAEVSALGALADRVEGEAATTWLEVGFAPGVTDAVARSVMMAIDDVLDAPLQGEVYSATLYLFRGLRVEEVRRAADELLHNPLIQRAKLGEAPRQPVTQPPSVGDDDAPQVALVPLRSMGDDELVALSQSGMLALSLAEMKAIQSFFVEEQREPTDAELECLAQTWSEHCKHKIFASPIHYVDPSGSARTIERGLFRQFIRGATEKIAADRIEAGVDPAQHPFLVSVFHDNAGVVRFTERDHLVYKVETHNSPSALDPYGGAMTGIVGVNRDSFGTGRGADLLTNVWGYCFGDPRYSGRLPRGLMHPRRIRDGVHAGVIDGGNHSGIPYARGFEIFDDRYAGKPLVYCGTVAAMPVERAGRPTHEKYISVGDAIVMVGGRIGKDGIHGATFSSVQLDETSPVQAVQIGDPLIQRMTFDFLAEACDRGLYNGLTDNGAGGLSSSVGELAQATNGARIDLSKAPLKYPGLMPWEVLVSEAQERMTISVPQEHLTEFMALAKRREVEASVLGEFTDSGLFEVRWGQTLVAKLPLTLLHEGVPLPTLKAIWSPPSPTTRGDASAARPSLRDALLKMSARPGMSTDIDRCRSYDHEVKGLSVVKPLTGRFQDVPSGATVLRVRHHHDEGVVLAEGIHPAYSDGDTLAMAHACVDEGVRRVLCAGARIDRLAALDNFCWPDPIESSKTPDGAHKLAQLVRCCEGLFDACVSYGVPLISGKDSMKNDAFLDGVKISIPPTLLVSVIGQVVDVAKIPAPYFSGTQGVLYVLGADRGELGHSEYERMLGVSLGDAPKTDLSANAKRYAAFAELVQQGMIPSATAIGRGGLLFAAAAQTLASDGDLRLEVEDGADATSWCFSESTGRILIIVTPDQASVVEQVLAPHGLLRVGELRVASDSTATRSDRRGQLTLVAPPGEGGGARDTQVLARWQASELMQAREEAWHGL